MSDMDVDMDIDLSDEEEHIEKLLRNKTRLNPPAPAMIVEEVKQ